MPLAPAAQSVQAATLTLHGVFARHPFSRAVRQPLGRIVIVSFAAAWRWRATAFLCDISVFLCLSNSRSATLPSCSKPAAHQRLLMERMGKLTHDVQLLSLTRGKASPRSEPQNQVSSQRLSDDGQPMRSNHIYLSVLIFMGSFRPAKPG